jgi:hypothetical protein
MLLVPDDEKIRSHSFEIEALRGPAPFTGNTRLQENMCDGDNAIDDTLLIVGLTTKKKKAVTFHEIEIIELAFVMGDNPSVSDGVPLTLEWIAQKRIVMTVDFFETYRPARCPTRRQLRLGETCRMNILLDSGYTQLEIDVAADEAKMTRELRRVSRDGTDEEEQPKQEEGRGLEEEYEEESNEEPPRQQQTNTHHKESSVMEEPRPFPHCDDLLLRRRCEPVVARSA